MASIKISDLNAVSTLNDNDVLPIVNNNETKKVSISQLADKFSGGGSGGSYNEYVIRITDDVKWTNVEEFFGAEDSEEYYSDVFEEMITNGETVYKPIKLQIGNSFAILQFTINNGEEVPITKTSATYDVIVNGFGRETTGTTASTNKLTVLYGTFKPTYNSSATSPQKHVSILFDNMIFENVSSENYVDNAISTAITDALGGSY